MDAPLLPLPIGGGVPSEHRLTPAELAHWREHGYVVAKGVFSADEAAALRSEAHALVERLRDTGQAPAVGTQKDGGWASGSLVDEGPRALDGCHNVQFHSALFSRMVCDPRLVERASDIIGPNVQLHHTKLFIKPPEIGAPFPMHQDVPYFEHESHSMIAAVVHFDESTIEKGCIRVVPGSWQRGRLDHIGEGGHHLEVEEYPVEQATPCEAEPGDVLFFSYLCIREWPVRAFRVQGLSVACAAPVSSHLRFVPAATCAQTLH
jgi:ectoine hydroxylase-related dioxygenase (phytanoyl-CoA dioxygenase family)